MGQLMSKVIRAFKCLKCWGWGDFEDKVIACYYNPTAFNYNCEEVVEKDDDNTSSLGWESEWEERSEDQFADESDFVPSSTVYTELPEPTQRKMSKREKMWHYRQRVDMRRRLLERKGKLKLRKLIRDRKMYELLCYHRLTAGMAPVHPLVFQRFDTCVYNDADSIRHNVAAANGERRELMVFMSDSPASVIPLINPEGRAYKYDLTVAPTSTVSLVMILRCGEYMPIVRYDGPFITLIPAVSPHMLLTITDTRHGQEPYFQDALRGGWHPNVAERCPFKLRRGVTGNWSIAFKTVSSFARATPWRRHN